MSLLPLSLVQCARLAAFLPLNDGLWLFQVQALRTVEKHLGLEKMYVLGTNCVDNGPRQGLGKFLRAASQDPDTVLHYEFMQVSIKFRQSMLLNWASVVPLLA